MQTTIQDDAKQIIDCFKGIRNESSDNRQYSTTIRKFAFTLHIYSPKAYNYIREKFNDTLPNPRTLTKWFAESDCSGEPGVLIEAVKTLKSAASQLKQDGKKLVGTIMFDEMAIQYDDKKKQFLGFIHYGKRNADGSLPVANNVLVFMFTALNYKISIPFAYYAITSLDAIEKRDLIKEMLTSLHSIDVKVVNITFDGLKSNLTACELLGASFESSNIIPHFPHPCDDSRVYIVLDSCHMLKLIRNALGDTGRINDPLCEGEPIE